MDSNHRSPARKSRFLLRKANCGTERGQPKRVVSYAVAKSLLRTLNLSIRPGAVRAIDSPCLPLATHFLRRGRKGARGLSSRHPFPLSGRPSRGSVGVVLEIGYVPQAEIWRINHGWRRSEDHNGFVIDTNTGAWQRQTDDDEEPNGTTPRAIRGQIRPYVSDTLYSPRRAIQVEYQIKEQEVAVERIGRDRLRRSAAVGFK
jgi:hypothetical protein